jgi:hypothetical protein
MRARGLTSGALVVLLHAAAFAVVGYALAQIFRGGHAVNFVLWFVGAAILHDLVLLPLYSLLDRLGRRRFSPSQRRPVPVVNHIRVPALISGILFLVFFPAILGLSGREYFAATGHHLHGYARNWLAITAALFFASGLIYAIRVWRADR